MKKKKIMALLLSGILAFSLFGCGKAKPETTKKENKAGGTMTVGISEATGNFNSAYTNSAYDGTVCKLVFDQLMKVDVDGNFVPGAAKSWELKDGGKTIIFKLRDDMKFSDGEKVTAKDVVFSYQFMADPSYTGGSGSYVKDLEGYDDYFAGKTKEFKGVVAIDDYTVQFNYAKAMRTNLNNCIMDIMPVHYYGKDFVYGNTSSIETLGSTPIGSGPYALDKFEPTKFISLKKNPQFKGEGYAIENVILKFVEMTTEMSELTAKTVDLLPQAVEPEKINTAKETDFLTTNSYDRSGYGFIKFNCENGPTADKKVRQALYYSFNLDEFIENYFKGLASIQYHPFSCKSWAVDDAFLKEITQYKFDMEKAKSLLDEDGWKVGASGFREKDGKVLELNLAAMPDHAILETLIPMWQRDWGEGLKVKLNVAYLEFNTLQSYVKFDADANVDKWNIFFMANTIYVPDPDDQYTSFHSSEIGSGKSNESRYKNPEVDKLFDEARTIIDREEAKPYYTKIGKILNEDVPMIPVYANTYYDLYNSKIKNLKTSSFCDWTAGLREAYIEE